MTEFQRLVLRALGALLYCAVWRDHPVFIRQGEDARKRLIDELRDAVHRPNVVEGLDQQCQAASQPS